VNGVTGGNATVGTISTSGLYTAPSSIPNPATVTITATSQVDQNASASANVVIAAFAVLYSFTGGADGGMPRASLIQANDGYLYGTSENGDSVDGAVFRVDMSGDLTVLHTFSGLQGSIGPWAPLVQANDGYFYGTTLAGGTGSCTSLTGGGCGTVFKIDASGNLTVLHTFSGGADGGVPSAAMIQATDGYLYGTTYAGGSSSPSCGTVFRIDTKGNLTTLYSFGSTQNDGCGPWAPLLQGADGYFYGTTFLGGGDYHSGTVFQMDSFGNMTVLYAFPGVPDGAGPVSALIQASDGNFYGTTRGGGNSACAPQHQPVGCGTIFEIDSSGDETTLYSFSGGADGALPEAALIQASDGNFYGTAQDGGNLTSCPLGFLVAGCGVIFELDSSSLDFLVLHSFSDSPDGAFPQAGLIQATDGNLYGTTEDGGIGSTLGPDWGAIFGLSGPSTPPGLQPRVKSAAKPTSKHRVMGLP
jgi:uncharacterized repeat protein (TIGR03803 family)